MAELLDAVVSWPALLSALLVFGFAPGFVLRLLVKIYPKGDPRRKELVAELYVLSWIQRPMFVAQQLETVLHEGVPGRVMTMRNGMSRRFYRTRGARLGSDVAAMFNSPEDLPSIRIEFGKRWYQTRMIRVYGKARTLDLFLVEENRSFSGELEGLLESLQNHVPRPPA